MNYKEGPHDGPQLSDESQLSDEPESPEARQAPQDISSSRRRLLKGAGLVGGALAFGGATHAIAEQPTGVTPKGGRHSRVPRSGAMECYAGYRFRFKQRAIDTLVIRHLVRRDVRLPRNADCQ